MVKQFLYIGMAILLCSCEVVREEDRLLPAPLPQSTRTHVLVEYTGFRCVNCPLAAETAQALADIYNERLIVVAMHPASNPFTQGLYDYTCPAADDYYRLCGGTAQTSFPTGSIDLQAANGTYLLDPSEWAAQLARVAEESTNVTITDVRAALDTTSSQIAVTLDALYNPTQTQMVYWLVEDSVPGVQAMPDGTVNMHYYHRHVLRAAVEDTMIFSLPEVCNPACCSVVAVAMDKTDRHILNAKQTHITTK